MALGQAGGAHAGDLLSANGKKLKAQAEREAAAPVYALAIATRDRKDDVRLSVALQKLVEEDPSLRVHHDPDLHETLLMGCGDAHLKVRSTG